MTESLYSLDAERSVIGSVFLNPDVLETVRVTVGPESFSAANGVIFQACLDCWEAGEPVDAVTVAERLEACGKLEDVGGVDALEDIITAVPHAAHADYYAGIVADKARRRQLCYAARELSDRATDPTADEDDLAKLTARIGAYRSNPHRQSLILERLSDVEITELEWLWPCRIPLGKLTLLAGDPGLGKSFITLDAAARVSRGFGWPDDPQADQPAGSVVLLSAEDDPADTIAPRLLRAGADLSRIHALRGVRHDDGTGVRSFNLERDLAALESTIRSVGDVRLVIIDPVSAYCGKTDSHKNADVRSLLAPLADLAARYRLAVVAVTHLSKGTGGKAIYRAMGSLAFVAAARAAWTVVKDQDNPLRRLVLPAKMNIAAEADGMAYAIVDGMVAWEPDPVKYSADDAMAVEGDPDAGELSEAEDWLLSHLQDGPQPAGKTKAAAKRDGITEKQLRTARKRVCKKPYKSDFDGGWTWELKDEVAPKMPKMPCP